MHSKDKLAAALRLAGLPRMADRAATGLYHDYLSPLAMPSLALMDELRREALSNPMAAKLAERHAEGEFDASEQEAEAWAESPEGRSMRLFFGE
jgi:hypothetical protein